MSDNLVIIENLHDLCLYFGVNDPMQLPKGVYYHTKCGPWITLTMLDGSEFYFDVGECPIEQEVKSFTIGTIVEGSDAEFSKSFILPIETKDVTDWMTEMERTSDETWEEANANKLEE